MAKTWAQKYEGYALRQATGIRNQIAAEVEGLRGGDSEKLERAEARLASWDELLLTYVKAKKPEPEKKSDLRLHRKKVKTGLYDLYDVEGNRVATAQLVTDMWYWQLVNGWYFASTAAEASDWNYCDKLAVAVADIEARAAKFGIGKG